jgi:hypothetical protein
MNILEKSKVKLENLVNQQCVSLMKQKFADDFKQKMVSQEFADSIRIAHKKMSISMAFQDQNSTIILVASKTKRKRYT